MSADDPAGGARAYVMESLERLRTSYINMMLIHYPKSERCDEKDERNKLHRKLSYLELEKLKHEGKIRSVGVSNYEIRHIEEIKEYSKMIPCANQIEIHPHFTREDIRQYCKKEGIFVQAFASLARMAPQLVQEPLLIGTAKKYSTSVASILLAWAHCQGIGVIPRSRSETNLRANIEMTKLVLTEEEIESISKLNLNKNYIRCYGWRVT
ncbi:Aldose reductase B [Trichostrongylus colubriformis]|uniref:Aldose reductase B n=1 Tax=Trichostrongylus colubriformis TaxID=6319 RepID=A0AAN8F5D2_TRICO